MPMSADAYRESLRRLHPTVSVDGERVGSVADDQGLAPGVAAIAKTYELASNAEPAPLMQARVAGCDAPANRMIELTHTTADLLNEIEAVRVVCQETGCAQRYLGGDALNALYHGTHATDAEHGIDHHARLTNYLAHVYANHLTLGVAMTDANGLATVARPAVRERRRRSSQASTGRRRACACSTASRCRGGTLLARRRPGRCRADPSQPHEPAPAGLHRRARGLRRSADRRRRADHRSQRPRPRPPSRRA